MPESPETQLARMDENIKNLLKSFEEVKTSITTSNSTSAEAHARASLAESKADDAKSFCETAFQRIDEAREERKVLTDFVSQLKGAGKAAVTIFGLFQALFVAIMIWLFSTVSTLRENRAILEYRVNQLEVKCSVLK